MQVDWVILKKIRFYFIGISGRYTVVDCRRCCTNGHGSFFAISFGAMDMAVVYCR